MLLRNQKPDRLRDQASNRTVGMCRMGIHAVVAARLCACACMLRISANQQKLKCLRQGDWVHRVQSVNAS